MNLHEATTQLDLFPDVEIVPTPAMRERKSFVAQCGWCGALICVPSSSDPEVATKAAALGTCPACAHPTAGWWTQSLNTGPFRARSEGGQL